MAHQSITKIVIMKNIDQQIEQYQCYYIFHINSQNAKKSQNTVTIAPFTPWFMSIEQVCEQASYLHYFTTKTNKIPLVFHCINRK